MSDGLESVGRELRAGIGAEVRADAEELERLAALAARRRRTFADVARDHMLRGDTVAVQVPAGRFVGLVVHVADDLVRLRTRSGEVDLRPRGPASLRVVERARHGGIDASRGPSSFTARLRELELAGARVELGVALGPDVLAGRLAAVAVDHVVLETGGGDVHVTLAGLAWVREQRWSRGD